MTILVKGNKSIDLEMERNAQIVTYPHYRSKVYGTIFCTDCKRFVKLAECKVCVIGRGR